MNSGVNIPVFDEKPEWEKVACHELGYHLWQASFPHFVPCTVQLCAVRNNGLFMRLRSSEEQPRATLFKRDDPVYTDSCMEIFLQPFEQDPRYINIEINPNCAYLSEIGTCRQDRVLLSSVTDLGCDIKPLNTEQGWGVEAFISNELVAACFSRKFCAENIKSIKANIYKCGDETPEPHYSSLFFVGTPKPDFHAPQFFGTINFCEERT